MDFFTEDELVKTFGKRIKKLRKEHKLTQSELAGKAELEKTAIQRIERGYNSTLKTINKLAKGFEVSLSELFNFKD